MCEMHFVLRKVQTLYASEKKKTLRNTLKSRIKLNSLVGKIYAWQCMVSGWAAGAVTMGIRQCSWHRNASLCARTCGCVWKTPMPQSLLLPAWLMPALLTVTLLPCHTHIFPADLFQRSSLVLGYLQQSASPEQ